MLKKQKEQMTEEKEREKEKIQEKIKNNCQEYFNNHKKKISTKARMFAVNKLLVDDPGFGKSTREIFKKIEKNNQPITNCNDFNFESLIKTINNSVDFKIYDNIPGDTKLWFMPAFIKFIYILGKEENYSEEICKKTIELLLNNTKDCFYKNMATIFSGIVAEDIKQNGCYPEEWEKLHNSYKNYDINSIFSFIEKDLQKEEDVEYMNKCNAPGSGKNNFTTGK